MDCIESVATGQTIEVLRALIKSPDAFSVHQSILVNNVKKTQPSDFKAKLQNIPPPGGMFR